MTTPTDYLRLVLDPIRLAVLGHSAVGPVDPVALAALLDVDERAVLNAVSSLRVAGLIDSEMRLDRRALVDIARAMPAGEPVDPRVVDGAWQPEELEVLGRFFSGARLREIPSNATKRAIVLERLAQEFEPGLRYEEQHVDRILLVFHPDYVTLRRYLVDHGFLTRASGVYWRTGGRYET